MPPETLDVLIVGAGLSGISAAWHLQRHCPGRRFALLESREAIGGTWDLFRYPGVRSDSDMHTLGYAFKPWTAAKAIADGPAILQYVRETAHENGIDAFIRFRHRVVRADFDTAGGLWTVDCERGEAKEPVRLACRFLLVCSGYYDYEQGHTPHFEGRETFGGRIVHPQHWPQDLDHRGRRVVVIGSGATAVTLVPAMADSAAHVTMLQRSPTYIIARPASDAMSQALRRWLPERAAYTLTRWKNVLLGMAFFAWCRARPESAKRLILHGVRRALGPGADVARDFTPHYNPWDQRLCLVPDADLFRVLRAGKASVVTDHVERFTESGIRLRSGRELPADIVVTATGLQLKLLGGMAVSVDGQRVDFSQRLGYKGAMCSDLPNLAMVTGYTNASWTLKADLTCAWVCRVLNHMQRHGHARCTPRLRDPDMPRLPWIDFSSGYVQRAVDQLPKQGARVPWRLYQNYMRDIVMLKWRRVDDGVLEFS